MSHLPIMIDSGAYSAFQLKDTLELEEYVKYARRLQREMPGVVIVNLDVIGVAEESYRNWKKMREAGIDALPVYHMGTDEKFLKLYLKETSYVAIGAIANMEGPKRVRCLDYVWERNLLDGNRMPRYRVHSMGLTSFPLMKRYPWYSMDSTSWLQASMYGKLFIPYYRDGQWVFDERPFTMAFSEKSGRRSERGQHIDNLGPLEKKHLRAYLKAFGFEYGETKQENGEDVVVKEGVVNSYQIRGTVNAFFYAQFLKQLVWPRPMVARKPRGLVE